MRIDLHVHQPECCARVEHKLDRILAHLNIIEEKENQMATTIQDILDGVNQESTVDDSIITLLGNIFQQLQNAGIPQAQLDAIKTVIDANVAKISAAVTANTPVVPPTP